MILYYLGVYVFIIAKIFGCEALGYHENVCELSSSEFTCTWTKRIGSVVRHF